MITPNSRARKGKGRGRRGGGGPKGKYGGIGGGMTRGMLTTAEWCNPVSNMSHHVQKALGGDLKSIKKNKETLQEDFGAIGSFFIESKTFFTIFIRGLLINYRYSTYR